MNAVERVALRPGYEISRVIRGGWQLAGGHGPVERERAVADFEAAFEAGIVTFDCADIYTGVEELIGEFRARYLARHGSDALVALKVHTKCVPDLALLPRLRREDVRATVERSLRRLQVQRLDLVQFHWWDYAIPGMVDAAGWLDDLRREGKIDVLGGTNFDSAHTAELLAAGIPLASMQVQYSLLDARPERALVPLCREHDVHLLCYGSVAGGFLSESWLKQPEPLGTLDNRSLTKYKLVVDDFGGWDLFQELLRVLHAVAQRHETDVASVASAYILAQPQVAAVIVGARNAQHLARNAALTSQHLDERDLAEIEAVRARGRGLAGEPFALERDRDGRHGRIMKYNLSANATA